jgi:serine/threonine-protein kinase
MKPGTQISHYRIVDQLGRGGMGIVYKAEDTKLDRLVALKFLPPQLSSDDDAKKRFVQEAKAASGLDHARICTIYEIGESAEESGENQLFIVMAYYEGQTLKYRLEEGLEDSQRLSIAAQLADGLERAHEAGIVHRDIKPANIMVTNRGEVKILDFGVAKLAGGIDLTKTGSTIGTAAYMSPEQVRAEPTDHRTDLWSLGVILYEMFAGQRPFAGQYDAATAYAILNEEPESLWKHRPDLSDELVSLVAALLSKNRDERPAGAAAVAKHIRALSAGAAEAPSTTPASRATEAQPSPASNGFQAWRKRVAWAVVGFAAIAAVGISLKMGLAGEEASVTSDPAAASGLGRSIAVLPFTDLSPAGDSEYIGDGMAEELIYGLGKVEGLRVVARSSSFYFKGRTEEMASIAERLNVDLVLEGSVRRDADELRITAQLVNAADGFQVWGERYDRRTDDVLEIQAEITRAIVGALKIRLTGAQSTHANAQGTTDPEAYRLYLLGRQQWQLRGRHLPRSIELFQQAVDRDPNFARAYAGLADAYVIAADWGYVDPGLAREQGSRAVQRAIDLAPDLAEAHATLGWILTFRDHDWEGAAKAFERALELDPDYATAYQWYSTTKVAQGEINKSITLMERALELDPLSAIINANQAQAYFVGRRLDEAAERNKSAIQLFPDFEWNYGWQGLIDIARGDLKAAKTAFGKCIDMIECVGGMGLANALEGNDAEARLRLRELEAWDYDADGSVCRAWIHASLGEMNKAYNAIFESIHLGSSFLTWVDSPLFDVMREDPRFDDLLRQLNMVR